MRGHELFNLMKLVVNPKYERFTDFLRRIPDGTIETEEVYKRNRNLVTRITHEGVDLVVKQFKVPNGLNKFVYSWLRQSKARRSFEYAQRLLDMGIDTAEPVAYIEIRKSGLFHTGYFISKFVEDNLLHTIEKCDRETQEAIIRDFARFTVEMNDNGLFHKDYNSGNIFYRKDGDRFRFALIDINRLRFRRPNKNEVINSLDRLTLSRLLTVQISAEYANLRGWNPDTLSGAVLMQKGMNMRKRVKNLLKRLFGSSHK